MKRRSVWVLGAAVALAAGCGGSDDTASGQLAGPTTTVPASTTTTTVAASTTVETIPAPLCTITVQPGDFMAKIADRIDGVGVEQLREENRLAEGHVIHPGDELDVCIDNDIDDVTGASRLSPAPSAVRRQQAKLNELFAPYRFVDLVVDGDSGPLTRQLLCAARMGLGMGESTAHMAADSDEEAALFAAESLELPAGAPVSSGKWILIDKTCQVMFTGDGDELVNIYPTSTGEPGHTTTNVNSVQAFRFNPALDTGGWHDSSSFPVEADNPLNGNMYKPIYFNDGEAIHGAGYVPPTPRSKGCARTFPLHQDELITWLGLDAVTEATWQASAIGLRVTVQGSFRPLD
ncbi:MAG: L,D-transpeptidase family protein [Ilumatobacter sp.]